jgi:NAD(P)H-nitrite reductase large subunit
VLEGQIDAPASEMVCEHLRSMKIKLVTNAQLIGVQRNSRGCVRRLHLADGRRIGSELVVACVGTRADLALAQLGGLATGRGIMVDAQMRSNVPNVYAAGDVAEFEGQAPGRWGVAADQARVAALSALGLPAAYVAHAPLTALKLPGIVVRCAGQVEARGDRQRELVLPPALPVREAAVGTGAPAGYAKLVIEGRCIIGAVFVGDDRHASKVLRAASCRAELASLRDVLAHRGNVAVASLLPLADELRRAA